MNLPNIITLSRIPVVFLIVFLLFLPYRGAATLAFILFVVGALSDLLDGFIARRFNIVSNFGKLIDALIDKIFVISLFVALVAVNFFGLWGVFCVLLIIGREFLVTGLRLVVANKGVVLAAESLGKFKTFSQNFAIGCYLFLDMLHADYFRWIYPWMFNFVHFVAISFFIIATILTVVSGVNYIVKYRKFFLEEAK